MYRIQTAEPTMEQNEEEVEADHDEDTLTQRPMTVGGIVGPIGIQPGWTLHLRDIKHRSFVSYRKGAFSG